MAYPSGRFKNSTSRIKRATDHARTFTAEWDSIFEKDGPIPGFAQDKGSGWFILSANLPPAILERVKQNTLALELGELAYQLRAALDSLMRDAVTYVKGSELVIDSTIKNNRYSLETTVWMAIEYSYRKPILHQEQKRISSSQSPGEINARTRCLSLRPRVIFGELM